MTDIDDPLTVSSDAATRSGKRSFVESCATASRVWHLVTVSCLILVFVALDVLIYALQPQVRERVLLWAALFCFVWPLIGACIGACAPSRFVLLLPCVPLFGIWLGLRYCDDVGSHGHMFLALPPFFAGIWGLCFGSAIAWIRK